MTFTIGMAHYNDFEGLWMTVQSALMHNDWREQPEIIIIDTSPQGSEHRRLVQNLAKQHSCITYVSAPHLIGTTNSREAIFTHATGDYVVVTDCHVMCPYNTLLRLYNWFKENPNCMDLIHGPMLYDDLSTIATHMVDQFRNSMRGTWSHEILCSSSGRHFCIEKEEVTDENRPRKKQSQYLDVLTSQPISLEVSSCEPVALGHTDSTIPIPIAGHGMGLFACRRDSWLGFAKGCTGFGGEELSIHDKYRLAGRNAVCLPFLKWNHRFGRAGGAPYPIPLLDKVRNYILWAKEVDSPELMRRTHTHFVKGGILGQRQWDKLVAGATPPPPPSPRSTPLDDLFQQAAPTFPYSEEIRNLVQQVESVTAFVTAGEWQPILAAGFPPSLTVYTTQKTIWTSKTHSAVEAQRCKGNRRIGKYETLYSIPPSPEKSELVVVEGPAIANIYRRYATKYLLTYNKELPIPINLEVV